MSEITTYIESSLAEAGDDLKAKFAEVVSFVTGKEQADAEKAAALAQEVQTAVNLLTSNGYTVNAPVATA